MSEIVKIICCDTLAITFTVAFCLAAVLCAVCAIVFVIQWIREEKGDRTAMELQDYLNLICLLNDKNIAELERRAKKMKEEYDINESEGGNG